MTAPLLRRLAAGLLILPLLFGAGCSDDKTERPSLTLSAEKIVLPSEAGATARLDVTASGPWQLEISGSGFDASPLHGGRGTTSVTLTATETNTSTARTSLGSLHLFMPQSGPELTVTVEQRPAVAAQTLLLYMPGRSLASYFEQNIEGIRRAVDADTPGDGRIFVCWQPASQRTAELFELYYDSNSASCATREVKTYTEFNAGDPESVHTLFAELADEAPALSYGLIIGCHGKAWVPASAGTLARGALRPSDGAKEYWQPAPGAYPTRSFGDSGYEMDITELADALAALPYRFDFLLFDDCFMANIETLYDLRASVDHVIASPCEIMADGFPYDRIIPQMFTDEGRSRTTSGPYATSSGTSTRTTMPRPSTACSRDASRWPSCRRSTVWPTSCAASTGPRPRSTTPTRCKPTRGSRRTCSTTWGNTSPCGAATRRCSTSSRSASTQPSRPRAGCTPTVSIRPTTTG